MERQRMRRMEIFAPKSKKIVKKTVSYEYVMDYIKEFI